MIQENLCFIQTAARVSAANFKHFIERGGMTDAETNQELSNEEVTERLNALYDELKSLKPYLPFQQIKRVPVSYTHLTLPTILPV